jgi:hypothetical protein
MSYIILKMHSNYKLKSSFYVLGIFYNVFNIYWIVLYGIINVLIYFFNFFAEKQSFLLYILYIISIQNKIKVAKLVS